MDDIIHTIGTAAGALRAVLDLASTGGNADLKRALTEALSEVLNAQSAAMKLQEENYKLRRQLEDDSERRALRTAMTFKDGVYVLEPQPAGYHAGPYCPGCLDTKGVPVTMHDVYRADPPRGNAWQCSGCKLRVAMRGQ